jgi:hypothetical protein
MLGMSYVSWEGPTARLRALLAAQVGRWDEAWAHFEAAIDLCRRLEAWPCLARTEYECARALLRRGGAGDLTRARPLLESALAQAERLG